MRGSLGSTALNNTGNGACGMGILFRFLEPPESNSIYRSGSCIPRDNSRVQFQRVIFNSNGVESLGIHRRNGTPFWGAPSFSSILVSCLPARGTALGLACCCRSTDGDSSCCMAREPVTDSTLCSYHSVFASNIFICCS